MNTANESDSSRRPRRLGAAIPLTAVLLIAAGALWLLTTAHPLPPRTITMATGPEGSAYFEFGKRYRELFSHEGIELRLESTDGSAENLARLRDPLAGVQIGFLSGGLTKESDSPELLSLGSVAQAPLWVFSRGVPANQGLRDLRVKRLSIGPEGSSTRLLALELLRRNAIDLSSLQLLDLPPAAAAEALLQGRIDAALILTGWDSPAVQSLIRADSVDLVSFDRADAYVALYPYLSHLVLPAGAGDLAANRPPTDVSLLAVRTNLVVRKDMHPALQYLLLEIAAQVHSGAEIFQKPGQFPTPETVDLPLSPHARHFYKSGRPFLQRFLPFWMAVLIEEALVLVIPLVGIIYPVGNGLAALYSWGMRRRILQIYGKLRLLEHDMDRRDADRLDLLKRLEQLEKGANRIHVMSPYMPMLYDLKTHIWTVRASLEVSTPSQAVPMRLRRTPPGPE